MPRIDTKTGRDHLTVRREPYWLKLETGRYIGFRKTSDSGFWIARLRDGQGSQRYRSLGEAPHLDYDAAMRAAAEWFESFDGTGAALVKTGTVAAACKAYAENLETEGREAAATDARRRFAQLVNDSRLGKMPLDRVTRDDITRWRDELLTDERGKAGVNRHLRTLKAALNEAVRMGYAAHPEAWRSVRAFSNADGSRDLFLNVKQRRALLKASPPPLRDFVSALFLTAARPGELARATVADFDAKRSTVTLRTMKGRGGVIRTRSVPLTPEALAIFKRNAKAKLPAAWLFTDANGSPWHRVYLSRELRAAAKRAKLPAGVVAYSMRHAAISEWLSAGVDPVTVAKMAGTSVLMIERHYFKFIKAPVMEKLAAVKLV